MSFRLGRELGLVEFFNVLFYLFTFVLQEFHLTCEQKCAAHSGTVNNCTDRISEDIDEPTYPPISLFIGYFVWGQEFFRCPLTGSWSGVVSVTWTSQFPVSVRDPFGPHSLSRTTSLCVPVDPNDVPRRTRLYPQRSPPTLTHTDHRPHLPTPVTTHTYPHHTRPYLPILLV